LVTVSPNEEIQLIIFDSDNKELTVIKLPENMQLNASHQRGIWKVSSLWKLGFDENMGGDLLADTLTNNASLPVNAWYGGKASSIASGSIVKILPFFSPFSMTKSNLSYRDKFELSLFSLSVKNANRRTIDLSDTTYLRKTVLVDGEEGYVVAGSIPQDIVAIFSNDLLSQNNVVVHVVNNTAKYGLVEKIGRLIEVVGAKVISVEKNNNSIEDCLVIGNDTKVVSFFADLFHCDEVYDKSHDNYEITIIIGKMFAERF
jgi:hypothetical protein